MHDLNVWEKLLWLVSMLCVVPILSSLFCEEKIGIFGSRLVLFLKILFNYHPVFFFLFFKSFQFH